MWDLVDAGDYIADKTGAAWKVLEVHRPYGRPTLMRIKNRSGQTADLPVPQEAFAVATVLVPTEAEALATLRGVFPNAEEIR